MEQHNGCFNLVTVLTSRPAPTRSCFTADPQECLVITINWVIHNNIRNKRL
jgi:hypothetical protein